MKILFGHSCKFLEELLKVANITISQYDPTLYIISNKPILFNNCYFVNRVIDKDLITAALNITCNFDLEIYVPDSRLFNKFEIGCLHPSNISNVWIRNMPSPFRNIKFDVFIIGQTNEDFIIGTRYILTFKSDCSNGTLLKIHIIINNEIVNSVQNYDQLNVQLHEEFKKLVQLIDSEPIIEEKPLEVQIAELREELAKSAQMTEQATKIVSLEMQIAELREIVYAYFPIREMEKLKLEVLETEKLRARNTELELEMEKLKKMVIGIHEISKIE